VLKEARAESKRLVAEAREAEERARGLLVDARATADGVRSEGMEIVSDLRQMGDSLRANAERLLKDIEEIHARMLSRLAEVEAGLQATPTEAPRPASTATEPESDELEVPDFVSRE
jgi:hypothetical protein